MPTDRTPYDLTAVREAYSILVEDVARGASPCAGVEMLREALDVIAEAELVAARQLVSEAIAAAVGNATTHEWTVRNRIAQCNNCQTMTARRPITTGAVPICTPQRGCRHTLVPQRGGGSRCSTCRAEYQPAAETAGVTR